MWSDEVFENKELIETTGFIIGSSGVLSRGSTHIGMSANEWLTVDEIDGKYINHRKSHTLKEAIEQEQAVNKIVNEIIDRILAEEK